MYSSYKEIREALFKQETSVQKLVEYHLQKIADSKQLNAFLEVYTDEALASAKQIDQKIADGTAGKLAGLVVGIKDVICHKNHKIQAASQILNGFESQFSATVIERLLAEDALIIGRQNCDEFAMGSTNESSSFGATLNNIDNERVPGGSSGASAVAVSADLCQVSIGSDTGGSVRQPAAFTGIVGLKPTYSRISRWGLIAYASSFDTIGILSKNVEDAALVLEIISGADEFDATVSRREVPAFSQQLEIEKGKKLKIAYIKDTVESTHLNADIKAHTKAKLTALEADGHEVIGIDFPLLDYLLPTYYILTTAEASTNLARFDGVHYGHRSDKAIDLESLYKQSRSEGFGREVQRRIMLGTFVLSASYYDAYFTKAQKVRRLIKEATEKIFEEYDFLVMPTTATPPAKIGAYTEENVLEMYLGDIYTVQANVVGMPAISIPNGTDTQGLPIGLQIMANKFEEEKMLAFSKYLLSL